MKKSSKSRRSGARRAAPSSAGRGGAGPEVISEENVSEASTRVDGVNVSSLSSDDSVRKGSANVRSSSADFSSSVLHRRALSARPLREGLSRRGSRSSLRAMSDGDQEQILDVDNRLALSSGSIPSPSFNRRSRSGSIDHPSPAISPLGLSSRSLRHGAHRRHSIDVESVSSLSPHGDSSHHYHHHHHHHGVHGAHEREHHHRRQSSHDANWDTHESEAERVAREPGERDGRHHHHHHHHHHPPLHHSKPRLVRSEFVDVAAARVEQKDTGFPVFEPRICPLPYPFATYWRDKKQVKNEILAGITVAFGMIPEAIAFSLFAGLPDPGMALHACWIMGLSMALFGRRPGMITGATEAMAVSLRGPIRTYGVAYLPYIVLLSSIFQLVAGVLRVGKLVRMIPITVFMGFTNGLAILIAWAQVADFQVSQYQCEHLETVAPIVDDAYECVTDAWIWDDHILGGAGTFVLMLCMVVVTMLIVQYLPRLTKIVPSTLIAIALAAVCEQIWRAASNGSVRTPLIGEIVLLEGLPPSPFFMNHFFDVPLTWETLSIVAWPAFTLAGVVVVEELMTNELVSEQTSTRTVQPNIHLMVLGAFQALAGFLGTMGGGAMIGLTMVNLHSGANGRYRISAVVAAVCVALLTFVATPLVKSIPTAALAGVMFVVAIHKFNWGSVRLVFAAALPRSVRHHRFVRLMHKIHRADALVILVVTTLTLAVDLFVATMAGVLASTFVFAWSSSHRLRVDTEVIVNDRNEEVKIYHLDGSVFFGSVQPLLHVFSYDADPDDVEIHMRQAALYDYTGVEALNQIGERYTERGKRLHLRHLSVRCEKIASKAHKLVKHFTYSQVERVGPEVQIDAPYHLHLTDKGVDAIA